MKTELINKLLRAHLSQPKRLRMLGRKISPVRGSKPDKRRRPPQKLLTTSSYRRWPVVRRNTKLPIKRRKASRRSNRRNFDKMRFWQNPHKVNPTQKYCENYMPTPNRRNGHTDKSWDLIPKIRQASATH